MVNLMTLGGAVRAKSGVHRFGYEIHINTQVRPHLIHKELPLWSKHRVKPIHNGMAG